MCSILMGQCCNGCILSRILSHTRRDNPSVRSIMQGGFLVFGSKISPYLHLLIPYHLMSVGRKFDLDPTALDSHSNNDVRMVVIGILEACLRLQLFMLRKQTAGSE